MGRLSNESDSCGLRLPAVASRLHDLHEELDSIDIIPYSRPRTGLRPSNTSNSGTVVVGIAPEFDLRSSITNFMPMRYLSAKSWEGHADPDTLLLPKSLQRDAGPIEGTVNRSEMLNLAERFCKTAQLS